VCVSVCNSACVIVFVCAYRPPTYYTHIHTQDGFPDSALRYLSTELGGAKQPRQDAKHTHTDANMLCGHPGVLDACFKALWRVCDSCLQQRALPASRNIEWCVYVGVCVCVFVRVYVCKPTNAYDHTHTRVHTHRQARGVSAGGHITGPGPPPDQLRGR
jgi:hypothetical protein